MSVCMCMSKTGRILIHFFLYMFVMGTSSGVMVSKLD